MVEHKVNGMCQMDRLYQQAKENIRKNFRQSADQCAENSYIAWKRNVHKEYYRLIAEAGIYIEGA